MQTFVPLPDIQQSMRVLDRQRLGKQRVEALQIWTALHDPSYGWQRHPAVLMWRGYEDALASYHNLAIQEWTRRGYKNNMPLLVVADESLLFPEWWGGPIHASQRAALKAKNPSWYEQFGWAEEAVIDYWWPTKHA